MLFCVVGPDVPAELSAAREEWGRRELRPHTPTSFFWLIGAGSSRTLRRLAVVGLRTELATLPISQKKEVGGLGGGVHSAPQPSLDGAVPAFRAHRRHRLTRGSHCVQRDASRSRQGPQSGRAFSPRP